MVTINYCVALLVYFLTSSIIGLDTFNAKVLLFAIIMPINFIDR